MSGLFKEAGIEEGMTNSLALYRPSILELARGGNFRAIAYWINSLLAPYGIYVRAAISRSGHLNLLVDFHQSRRREFYIALRKHLVRFICYRLWTLNSDAIQDVRIVARIAGDARYSVEAVGSVVHSCHTGKASSCRSLAGDSPSGNCVASVPGSSIGHGQPDRLRQLFPLLLAALLGDGGQIRG
ncbi:hypothetical protein K9N68_06190 [Kovacikia minuta CCNUW1]|uniref:hypothetical protein n=1 Tax=Kovacikia minuta TaxID=2931930 RepID=UPI001CCC7A10|nr:hypothetical protein [Kovacikia minuta]UBF27527.1 hypothetical protein K9N68_06190 [Kovacikia minuta CCNUW1]